MKIKIINPNTSQEMTSLLEEQVRGRNRTEADLIFVNSSIGPESIECFYDEYLAIPGVLEEILKGDRDEGVNGFVIACFGDPGLFAAREITEKPVVGIAEAAMYTARMLAPSFSIIDVLDRSRFMAQELVRMYGMEKYCASVRTTGLGVMEFIKDRERGLKALEEQSRLAVEKDGSESILLGCAGFIDFVEHLTDVLTVPVIDGVLPAIQFVHNLVSLGLKTSKKSAFSFPDKKNVVGYSELLGKGRHLERKDDDNC